MAGEFNMAVYMRQRHSPDQNRSGDLSSQDFDQVTIFVVVGTQTVRVPRAVLLSIVFLTPHLHVTDYRIGHHKLWLSKD